MVTENGVSFGWIPAPPEKQNLHAALYGFQVFLPFVAAEAVNVVLPRDPKFAAWFDQDKMNACVAASTAKTMAMSNLSQVGAQQYNWREHYRWACANDNDPQTSYERDVGTYLWAGMDCLRKVGAYIVNRGFDIEHGLDRYFWITGANAVDQGRTAIANGQPTVVGMPWPESGFNPIWDEKIKMYRFPGRSTWKKFPGGHAIAWIGALDKYNGFVMSNSWAGAGYPDEVLIDYSDAQYLMTNLGAEWVVGVDRNFVPPPPPAKHTVSAVLVIDGISYPLKEV